MVFSRFGSVNIPDLPLHEYVFEEFENYGDRTALVCGETGRKYSYREMRFLTRKIANSLARRGYRKGDVAGLLLPNIPEFGLITFGCLRAGMTVSPINPAYTAGEISRQLLDSNAKFLCTVSVLESKADDALKQANNNVKEVIVIGQASSNGKTAFADLIADDVSMTPDVRFDVYNDVAFIPYSSGTTGVPKGVLLTHRNIVANGVQASHPAFADPLLVEGEQQSMLSFIPFFHSYGLGSILCQGLRRGYKLVTLPRFVPEQFLNSIQTHKVTILPLVPPIVVFLSKSPLVEKYDLSSVRRVFSGAAPLSKETETTFKKRLNIKSLQQGYGLTETSPGVTSPLFTDQSASRPGHSGVLLPNTEARVVDIETGKSLGANQRGELWVRGPQVMKGYLNRPEATKEMLDDARWLHTGDVAYYDEDGFFFIVDRIKELIKYKGFQVAPAEMEALLLTHPGVSDAGVVGLPNEEAGELPTAFVVKKPGSNLTQKEIHAFVNERTASFKHFKGGIYFLTEIPKSQSGKILRRNLKELAKENASKQNSKL